MKNWLSEKIRILSRAKKAPEEVTLHYLRKTWEIICDPHLPSKKACEHGTQLILPVTARRYDDAILLLKQWLRQKAWLYLPEHLAEVSKEHNLSFSDLSIRAQKSRWGSCNSHKKISLNAKLLFLPRHLVEYVIIHELCHTKHLNHSPKFWNLVEHHLPHYRKSEHEIKHEKHFIPEWFS